MPDKKKIGAFYTPKIIADFVVKHISTHLMDIPNPRILEPSVGDGKFVEALGNCITPPDGSSINLVGVELIKEELDKTRDCANKQLSSNFICEFINEDYLKIEKNLGSFSLVLGNPPYVKKSLLDSEQMDLAKEVYECSGLSTKGFKNLWSVFLIKSIELLEDNGILAFVLPSELLQVKFAEEIRSYLSRKFDRIEVFTFDELLFDSIGQDTILLFCYKNVKEKGQYFCNVKSRNDLLKGDLVLKMNPSLINFSSKWTNHILKCDELEYIYKLANGLEKMNHYCESKPGVVTAANDYFIINTDIRDKFKLDFFTKPIVQKGSFVNGSVVFDNHHYRELVLQGKPTFFLDLNQVDPLNVPSNLVDYLNIGKERKIHLRYKCKKRTCWYKVPNVSKESGAFFFKRAHLYPKLLKNKAEVLVTDSGYKVDIKEEFEIENLIFSFYNSLTLLFSELEGRYYGGGVLELTPNEFKVLPLPYVENDNFEEFQTTFESKDNIKDILVQNNHRILNEKLGLCDSEIIRLEEIREKLVNRRLRN